MSIRQQKVAAQIRRIVSEMLTRGDIDDPRITGLVTITKVELTPDLREAHIYVSLLGPKGQPSTVVHGLNSAARHVQMELREKMPIRYVPHVDFRLDETLKKEAEILKQINKIASENSHPATPAKGP